MKIKFLIVLVLIFAISAIFLTIETATNGTENAYLEQKQEELSLQKKELENNLVISVSMTKLEEDSLTLGFVKPTNYLYINGDEQVASLR